MPSAICSSEGEVWVRIVPDEYKGHACIERHSRLNVVPLFINGYVVAAAFVSVLDVTGQGGGAREVWRYVEVHGDGLVRRLLYKGTEGGSTLGTPMPLTARPETEEYEDTWQHGLGLLGGRIVNKLAVTRIWGCRTSTASRTYSWR